jgi:hypothetical protein
MTGSRIKLLAHYSLGLGRAKGPNEEMLKGLVLLMLRHINKPPLLAGQQSPV